MKCLKMLGLAAGVAALMVFAGSASATVVTSPAGTQYSGTIAASLKTGTSTTLKSSFIGEVVCEKSALEGKIETQGAGITAGGGLTLLSTTSCNGTATILKIGAIQAHGTGGGHGTLTSSGTEVTTELFGLHCIFTTNNTNLGTITGGTPASIKVTSLLLRTGGRSGAFCGSTGTWSAEYNVTTPGTLLID